MLISKCPVSLGNEGPVEVTLPGRTRGPPMRTPVTTLALLGLVPLRPPRAAAWHAEGRVAPAQVARQLSDKRRAALGQILKARPHGATVPGARRPEDTPPAQGAFLSCYN